MPEKDFCALMEKNMDIVSVVSDHVTLEKSGGNFKGHCPFHKEKTPSFIVSPEKQVFHCFGCGEGGNVGRFLRKIGENNENTA